MNKKDIFVVIALLIVIAVFLGINMIINSKNGEEIEIYVDNKLYKSISIDESEEIKIETPEGYNIIKVHDKGVEIIDASCPDKVCVHTGFVKSPSKTIVCIPNKVYIKIKADRSNQKEDIISN